MFSFSKIESLIESKKSVFIILLFLCLVQFFYSFLFFGGSNSHYAWKTILDLNSYKGYNYDSFDGAVVKLIYPLISNYRIHDDASAFILLAYDFPNHYFQGHLAYLNRPLFPFLVYLISTPLHFISDSYSMTFCAGILLNFILFFLTVFIFYLFLRTLISSRVAFLSSFLVVFSPLGHIWIVQPGTEIFGNFIVIFILYLLYKYISRPSSKRLLFFSLIAGVLMLGKMILALPFFIFILAIYFKRWKEGIIFLAVQSVPFIVWYFITSKIWGLGYFSGETAFQMFIFQNWILNIFNLPWQETFKIILDSLPSFIFSLSYGFLLFPLIFALFGFKDFYLPGKNIFIFLFIFSFFLMFFGMNYYAPRHSFLLFPVVYPLAVLGIDKIAGFFKKYKNWYSLAFYLSSYLLLIIISSVNIFNVFAYSEGFPWLN